MDHVNILHTACERCLLKPENTFTIKDIWHTFGYDWDCGTSLPTLNIEKLVKLAVCNALEQCDYNQSAAAKMLGISRMRLNRFVSNNNIKSKRYSKNKPTIKGDRDIESVIRKGELFQWIGIE